MGILNKLKEFSDREKTKARVERKFNEYAERKEKKQELTLKMKQEKLAEMKEYNRQRAERLKLDNDIRNEKRKAYEQSTAGRFVKGLNSIKKEVNKDLKNTSRNKGAGQGVKRQINPAFGIGRKEINPAFGLGPDKPKKKEETKSITIKIK